jgi:hypothetical protein
MIKKVTGTTRILSLNALIEANRAGDFGRGFAVVAHEVKTVSDSIDTITRSLEGELSGTIDDLMSLGETMVRQLRGSRLTDLSLGMIDIIDRNLYERSCDVRWWATDSAVVGCLTGGCAPAYASKRLGVILASYTVYLDLWIADANGKVIANGRPDRYSQAIGTDVSDQPWFREAMASRDGSAYAVADIAAVPRLDGALVATYAAAIRESETETGAPLGVLGIFFDWQPQSRTVVNGVRLREDESATTRCLLIDQNHRVIAASGGRGVLTETFTLDTSQGAAGSYIDPNGILIGYARTPGYETYAGLGWYGVIAQRPRDPSGRRPH